MRTTRPPACLIGLLTLAATALPVAGANPDPPEGFTPLFNGENLDGWRGRPHISPYKVRGWSKEKRREMQAEWNESMRDHWSVEDGEIVSDGHGVFLTTERDYRDFELIVEYKMPPKSDSGIYLRANPQVQIWDYTKEGGKWDRGADKGSGGLWNNKNHERFPPKVADKPFGQWNRFRIRMVGQRVTVTLNGVKTVDNVVMENFFDRSKPVFTEGPIQLQTHGGQIHFRNISIRRIGPEEANRRIRARHADGFERIFNGRNLDGWRGATDKARIENGALIPAKGTLYTEQTYGDFEAMLRFKLPPAGNNGLAIRYPGEGSPASHGMCELQVLDNTAAKYSDLDPRQYHGSAYGMAAAHRGYLRPTGQWNFQHIRVKGSDVRVELNGTVILNADLAKIEDYMKDQAHPGKDRQRGHFGFAGHGDPVRYREIEVKRLNGETP